jgi:drug/metabolite transporter (DMT)-like permease
MSPVLRGTFWMAMCMLSFAGVALSVRALSSHLPIVEIVLFRAAFGVAVSLPWLWRTGIGGLKTTCLSLHFGRSVVNGLGMFCWFTALGMMAIGDVLALQFTSPLFMVLLGALVLREAVGRSRWIATAIGFGGALIIIRPGFGEVSAGVFFVLAAAILYAGNHAMTKPLARKDSGGAIVFYMNAIHLPVFLVLAPTVWVAPAMGDAGWVILLGVCGATAHVFLARALRLADLSTLALVDFLKLPVAAGAGYFLFGDRSDLWTWAGAAVIFGAGYYNVLHERAREREQALVQAEGGGGA